MTSLSALASPFFAFQTRAFAPERPTTPSRWKLESAAFHYALVALAAKIVAVDGVANKSEYAAFQELFIEERDEEATKLRSLFVKHLGDHSSALQYARQIAQATPNQPELHKELLERLVNIATADGAINAAEFELLRAIANVMGLVGEGFREVMNRHLIPAGDPYKVLGIASHASDAELRSHYLARVQKLHPDMYQAAGASKETVAMLSDQLAAINAAYESIRATRAKKSARNQAFWGPRKTKGARS